MLMQGFCPLPWLQYIMSPHLYDHNGSISFQAADGEVVTAAPSFSDRKVLPLHGERTGWGARPVPFGDTSPMTMPQDGPTHTLVILYIYYRYIIDIILYIVIYIYVYYYIYM